MWIKHRWLFAILAMALVAVACGDDDAPVATAAPTTTAASGTTAPATTAAAPATTAAATPTAAPGPATGEPYVVGISSDFTGFGASNYAALAEAMRVYFEALNDAGGIDGHPVELIIRDHKSDPAIVASDMKFFDQEGTTAVYFNGFSSTIAAATSAASEGTPILYGNACYPPAPPPDVAPNFFCAGISPVGEGRALVDLLVAKRQDASGIKLGLLPSDLPGTRFAHGVVIGPYAESLGIEVVDTQIIPMSVTDLTAAARRFVDRGVNAVISYSAPSHVIGIAEALHRLGWMGRWSACLTAPEMSSRWNACSLLRGSRSTSTRSTPTITRSSARWPQQQTRTMPSSNFPRFAGAGRTRWSCTGCFKRAASHVSGTSSSRL